MELRRSSWLHLIENSGVGMQCFCFFSRACFTMTTVKFMENTVDFELYGIITILYDSRPY